MYQVIVSSEDLLRDVNLDEVKVYACVSNSVEDAVIERMVKAAVRFAEAHTGNYFTAKTVRVIYDMPSRYDKLRLPGVVDSITSCKVDGVTTGYELIGNVIRPSAVGVLDVEYITKASMPDEVKLFVMQQVAKMYARGSDIIVEPDLALLSRLQILSLC